MPDVRHGIDVLGGNRLFQPVSWHGLLPGRDLPGFGSAMPTRGKEDLEPPSPEGGGEPKAPSTDQEER